MHLILGLGNKGSEYNLTRHNMGFEAVEAYARKLGAVIGRKGFSSLYAKAGSVILAKPQTYMNLSGRAASELVAMFKVPLENVLVAYDDMDFEPGVVKLRKSGSAGGHNGMADVLDALHTNQIARIRIGIGRPPHSSMPRDYVLSRIPPEEMDAYRSAASLAADAIEAFVARGIDAAMNEYNAKGGIGLGRTEL